MSHPTLLPDCFLIKKKKFLGCQRPTAKFSDLLPPATPNTARVQRWSSVHHAIEREFIHFFIKSQTLYLNYGTIER